MYRPERPVPDVEQILSFLACGNTRLDAYPDDLELGVEALDLIRRKRPRISAANRRCPFSTRSVFRLRLAAYCN
jgi:hypothetical protein